MTHPELPQAQAQTGRDAFLAAVRYQLEGHPPVDAMLREVTAEHFLDLVDAHHARWQAMGLRSHLPYATAVVIEGNHQVVVTTTTAYAICRVDLEATAGEVTSVIRGVDLLAGA